MKHIAELKECFSEIKNDLYIYRNLTLAHSLSSRCLGGDYISWFYCF